MEVTRFEVSHLTPFQEQGSEPVKPKEAAERVDMTASEKEREVGLGILIFFPKLHSFGNVVNKVVNFVVNVGRNPKRGTCLAFIGVML